MSQKPKIFKKGDQIFDVPSNEVTDFLNQVPDAVEVNVYEKDGTTYDVPVNELDQFMQEVPGATLVEGSKKKVSTPESGTTKTGPGRSSMGLSPLPASVGESIIAGEPEKDPILIKAAEKSPWLAAPINFLTGAVKGTAAHIMKPLDGAQRLFYKGVGSLMELSSNPTIMAEGMKLKAQQDDPKYRTWFKTAQEGIDLYAQNRMPEPDKGDFFSALVYNLGELAPFMGTLVATPNPSIFGIGAKLPINIAGQSAMSTYADTGDLGQAVKAGAIGLGDGAMLMMMGYGAGKASQWVTKSISNKLGPTAGIVGATSGAGMMYGGGVSTNITKQLISGRRWDQLNWDEANQEGALFFALGVPGIVNSAASVYLKAPYESLALARRTDVEVNKIREREFELIEKAEKEVDPDKKAEYILAAQGMHHMADIKAMDQYFGKNAEKSIKDIENSALNEADKKALIDRIKDSELYNSNIDLTKDLATAGDQIAKAEAERAAKEPKIEEKPVKTKEPKTYTSEEVDLKYETTPRLEARITHEKFGVDKMMTELDRIESEGKYENEKLRTKEMSRYFPEAEGDYLDIKSKEDVEKAREVLADYKLRATKEITRRQEAGETDLPEGKYVMGRVAFESKEALFKELDKMPRDEGGVKVPEVLDLETMKAIEEYESKLKEDAIQERKTEKVPVAEAPEAGKEVDGKVREQAAGKEEVPYITPETSEKYADLTETPEGDYVFFHYSPEKRTVIDPKKSGSNKGAITGAAEIGAAGTVGGMNYYYTNTSRIESGVGKEQHIVRVPKEKVYDGNKDPLNFREEAKRQFKAKHPDTGYSPNHQMAWITKVAGENGFDMVVVDWAGRTRAQSTKAMTPEAMAPEYMTTAEKGYKKQPPVRAEDTYSGVLDEINKHQDKKGVYDELYHARTSYTNPKSDLYQNKEGITTLVEKSDLPAAMKKKYMDALEAKDIPGVSIQERTGKQNEAFFTEKSREASSKVPYEPVIKIDKTTPVAKAYNTYSAGGNFTGHISKMIPGFQEKQVRVAEAVTKSGAKSFLDIGASEGGLVKTIAAQDPNIRAVAVDPNSQMKKNFESTPEVPNAEFRQEAFQGSWTEADGTKINEFKTDEKFDVINEDFTFQFVNNDRAKQVSGVKEMLAEDGLFITSEKFHTVNKAANEAKKAEHQKKYFTPEERTADAEGIVTGMDKDMVKDTEYFDILQDNFKYVEEFWNAGEFKGFVASDSKASIDSFRKNVGDLTTEFTDAGSLTAGRNLPANRNLPAGKGGPPAKPPKPPEVDEGLAEVPKGPGKGKKPEKDVIDLMKDIHKERDKAMKKRKKMDKWRPSYLFWDQQEAYKRAVLGAAKKAGVGKIEAQRVVDRKNTEKGSKARTAKDFPRDLKYIVGDSKVGPKHMDLVSDINDMRRTKELYKSREAMGKGELLMEGGVSLKQAEDFLTRVKNKDKGILDLYKLKDYDPKKLMEVSDRFNEKYKDLLDEMLRENLITQAGYDAIVFEHPYYSPRKFIDSMDKMDPGGSLSGIESLKGGSEGAKMVDAPALYFEALSRKNAMVARARTFRAMENYIKIVNPDFMKLADYAPGFLEKMSKAERVPVYKGEGSSSRNVEVPGIGKVPEKIEGWIEPQFKDTPKGMEAVDYIDANGNRKRVFMDAETYKYFEIEPFGDLSRKIMNVAGWVSGTKPLKMAATGYNPEFMIKNVPIDMMHILMTTDVYSPVLPIAAAQMHADIARIAKDVATRSGRVEDYINEGGGMDMLTGEGRLRHGVSKQELSQWTQGARALENAASWLGTSSELLTRIALRERKLTKSIEQFKKQRGRDPNEKEMKELQLDATAYARNYLDFEQGGRLVKMADSVIPYLNAGFQVTRGSIRAAGKNPALFSAKVAQVAGVATAITMWNMGKIQTKGIDEEKASEIQRFYLNDISDEVKARNFVLMTPFKYTDANGVEKYLYFKFQKDNMQELITGVAEDRVHREVMGDLAPSYLSPRRLKELQVMTEGFTNVSQLPPAIRGSLGYKLNKDFFYNSELWMGYDLGRDKSLEYRRDTPERYKFVGKIPLPGGHKLSPTRSHYVAKQFFTESNVIATGIGEYFDSLIRGAAPELATEYEPGQVEKFKNAPFARRFFKSTYPGASKQDTDTYQQQYNRIKQDNNLTLDNLIDKESSPDDVYGWLESIVEEGDGNITSIKEFERLSKRYEDEVLMPAVNSWVERLKYIDAIPRAQELFDQWVHMNDSMRDNLLETAVAAGVLTDDTIIKFEELVDEYDAEYEKLEAEKAKEPATEVKRPRPKRKPIGVLQLPSVNDVKGKDVEIEVEIEETGQKEKMKVGAVEVRRDIKRRYDAINELIANIG